MQHFAPLFRAAERAGFPGFFADCHVSAIAAYPEYGRIRGKQRAVFYRAGKIIENDPVRIFYFRDQLVKRRNIGKAFFFRRFGKFGVEFRFRRFVVCGKGKPFFKRTRMERIAGFDADILAAARLFL